MKVVLLHNIPAPYRIPLFQNLAKKLDIFIYFMAPSERRRKWKPQEHYDFGYKILSGFSICFRNRTTQELFDFHINPNLAFELFKKPYDVMIIGGFDSLSSYIAFAVSKIRRKPIIMWIGNTLEDEPSTIGKVALPVIKLVMKLSDAFIVYGTRAKEYVMSFGIPQEKIHVAINVGNVDFFMKEVDRLRVQKEKIKRELGLEGNKIILYVGQLIDRKGVKYLVEAFNKLKVENKNASLLLIGNGPQREELEMKFREVEDVYFIESVQPEKLSFYYAISDVFVLPSLYERFGIVISEAMAAGLPVIDTERVGASVDLLKNGINGYVIKDKDSDALYDALKKILNTPAVSQSMSNNSKQMIRNEFNLEKTAQGFIEAINFVIKARR